MARFAICVAKNPWITPSMYIRSARSLFAAAALLIEAVSENQSFQGGGWSATVAAVAR
jgi:hypothetical protein